MLDPQCYLLPQQPSGTVCLVSQKSAVHLPASTVLYSGYDVILIHEVITIWTGNVLGPRWVLASIAQRIHPIG